MGERVGMLAMAGMILASCTGVLLAALEGGHAHGGRRLHHLSVALIGASAATLAAAGLVEILWE